VLYGSNAFSGVINLITRKESGQGGGTRGFGTGAGESGGSAEGWYNHRDFRMTAAAQFHQGSRWNTRAAEYRAESSRRRCAFELRCQPRTLCGPRYKDLAQCLRNGVA